MTPPFQEKYYQLLRNYYLHTEEEKLEAAYQLGKELVSTGVDITEIGEMHTLALQRLAQEFPDTNIAEEKSHIPLLEVLVAYGMAFRAQMEWLHEQKISLEREAAERRRAQAGLRQAAEEWRRTFDAISDAVTIHDLDFKILRANRAAAETFGMPIQDLPGKKCYRVFHDQDHHIENCPLLRTRASLSHETLEYWEPTLEKWLSLSTDPLFDEQGKLAGVVHVSRDITSRVTGQQKIRRQVAYLEALRTIDAAITASMDLDVTARVIVGQAHRQLAAGAADILIYNEASHTLECLVHEGFKTAAMKNARLGLGHGLAGRVALQRKLINLPDLREEREALERIPELKAEGFVAYWGAPLIAKGELKGVLEIYYRERFVPDDDWLEFLNTLARLAGIPEHPGQADGDRHRQRHFVHQLATNQSGIATRLRNHTGGLGAHPGIA